MNFVVVLLLLTWVCLACRYEASVGWAIGIDDDEETSFDHARSGPALLAIVLAIIYSICAIRVQEDQRCVGEGDVVFFEVVGGLGVIPFKGEGHVGGFSL